MIMDTPEKRTIIEPKEGWKAHTVYLCDVAFSKHNPIHRALVAIGFVEKGKPGNYSEAWSNSYDTSYQFRELHYCKPIKELCKLK